MRHRKRKSTGFDFFLLFSYIPFFPSFLFFAHLSHRVFLSIVAEDIGLYPVALGTQL